MKVKKKRNGDIYLNPVWCDLWVLYKGLNEDNKNTWLLSLIGENLIEELKYVEGFIYVGNIYDMCYDKLKEKGLIESE